MFVQSSIYFSLWIVLCIFSTFLQLLMKIGEFGLKKYDVGRRYDYIVVGGGSAGSIIAGRLSENPNLSVLLIEAGGEGFDILNIPVLGPLKQLSVLDWQYRTVPQKHSCFGLEKNVSKWPSGKILGGSTHLNYMIYLKGHRNDFKTWKSPDGDHWNDEDINFYFEKGNKCSKFYEDFCIENKGSINVRQLSYSTSLSDAILEAAKELGYVVNDLNTKTNTGFMKPQLNLNHLGMRWTSDQYLKSEKSVRKNLHFLTNAVAEKILLLNGFEAYAVRIRRHGKQQIIYANFEIIISAGSIGSPKLLMLSGIGPENSLAKSNITTKIDLPVGKNLQDHVTTGLDLGILNSHLFSLTDLMLPSSAYKYFVHGTGPFTSGFVDAVGIIHSPLVNPIQASPDLEFMVMVAGASSDKGVFFRNAMGISQKTWDEYFALLMNESVITILPVLLHPKSVGEITLNPDDPFGMPKIDPRYLSNEEDVTTLVEGIKIIRKVMETKALRNFGLRFNDKLFPGCVQWLFDSDDYWRCYVRHLTLTVYHPVGTCKMDSFENGGVVDHRLKVHKTNKLRIIDASVMPTMPSANPNAAVMMIAEKGADMIKEDFSSRYSSCRLRDVILVPSTCPSVS